MLGLTTWRTSVPWIVVRPEFEVEMKYIAYFVIGGTVVSLVTYLASHSRGLAAAFVANMPVITLITFLIIFFESGQEAVVSYAKGLVIMLLPWLAYILSVILLSERLGMITSLAVGVSLYLIAAFFIMGTKGF